MPYWYFDKKALSNTPSFQDGINHDTEMRYRKEGARFIIDTGSNMDLGYNTVATGVVYFHRFYMFHSFRTFPRYITACCCLFLAGKVEETPKKCKDIIKQAKTLLTEQKFSSFGEDPKEEVMTLERILLQTIKFDLQVEHPYSYLIKYAKCLKGDKNKLQKMVQMAWTFVNDSLCTTLCLQWEPEVIAVALMFLAGKLSKFEVSDWNGRHSKHTHWWDMFVEDITMELLEDICHQVLDLYSPQTQKSGADSPPLQALPAKNDKKPSAIQPVSASHIDPIPPLLQQRTNGPMTEGVIPRLPMPQQHQATYIQPQNSAPYSTDIHHIPALHSPATLRPGGMSQRPPPADSYANIPPHGMYNRPPPMQQYAPTGQHPTYYPPA